MDTIKDIWYAVIDERNNELISVFKEKEEAESYIGTYESPVDYNKTKVERVRVTIDRIKS